MRVAFVWKSHHLKVICLLSLRKSQLISTYSKTLNDNVIISVVPTYYLYCVEVKKYSQERRGMAHYTLGTHQV